MTVNTDGQILYKGENRTGYLFASSRVVMILNLDMLIISYFFKARCLTAMVKGRRRYNRKRQVSTPESL